MLDLKNIESFFPQNNGRVRVVWNDFGRAATKNQLQMKELRRPNRTKPEQICSGFVLILFWFLYYRYLEEPTTNAKNDYWLSIPRN